jgi:hypothetical protein
MEIDTFGFPLSYPIAPARAIHQWGRLEPSKLAIVTGAISRESQVFN